MMARRRWLAAMTPFLARALTTAPGVSVRSALERAVQSLRSEAVPEPEASAEWLLAHVLGATTRSEVGAAVAGGGALGAEAAARFDAMVARRRAREPTQYIVGSWPFHDVELEMRSPVLIPRPETEELVDMILDWWRATAGDAPAAFADVGCGTGALGLALLNALPAGSSCAAVDVAPAAVALARVNAARLGLSGAFSVVEATAGDLEGSFDFVASNPPYIPTGDLRTLDAEVADWEDPGALDGGADGLDVARELLARAPAVLRGPRAVWLELDTTGPGRLAAAYPSAAVECLDDLSGRPRFALLRDFR